ncbi:circularly permuted type 2 ATP-grasp protein [Croceibacterium mercuriale]|uniref:circularly permuted type 2 ATP-grasp protein n=1 Tax=Croceibacterium mercuriale TaxID=1572751 RepID=UPI0009DFBE2C|nr:circularly permuted type 2 ATP-grasp protein [Croceibacterium mercuriale]
MASLGADLFGADPAADPLAWYGGDAEGDLFSASSPAIADAWRGFVAALSRQGGGQLGPVQAQIDRHVAELGIAFRLTGDEQERSWPLGPVPIVIGASEWRGIAAGLVQRAELLETIVADIYGPQRLVREGHLPAAMVSGSPHFARRMVGLNPPRHHLQVLAVDLARGPTGEWRVLADRVRFAIGIGYALENRLAISRATGGALSEMGARRQSDFFAALRAGIAADCQRSEPRVALLTAGRFNQSYPEQAYLARHLGFSLVEGRDLVVRDGRLFVRTIAGLKRIDALWRWINTHSIDPLNFDTRSRIGVPGLLSACESGQLSVANWMGGGVVESRAMSAFIPRLCRELRGEPLLLPNAATWWCGGPAERDHVLEHLDDLVLSSSFRTPVALLPDGATRQGSSLTAEERVRLREAMGRRAMDYTAQEIIRVSTTPCLVGNRLEPRGFTLRAFLARNASGAWTVLPGGLGRISQSGELRTWLMGEGDLSADVCIVDPVATAGDQPFPRLTLSVPEEAPAIRRGAGLLPSQAADNLFWFGRYAERCQQVARAARTLLQCAGDLQADPGASGTVQRLSQLLYRWGAVSSTYGPALDIAAAALGDTGAGSSVASLEERMRSLALLLRDRLSRDSWRAISRPHAPLVPGNAESLIAAAEAAIERGAAVQRLIADTLSRADAWRFLDVGLCLERASLICQAVNVLVPAEPSADDLGALLDLADAEALYISRYMTRPFAAPVIDVVLLDPEQPRGAIFQTRRLVQHMEALPQLRHSGRADPPLRMARQLHARIEALEAEHVTPRVIDELVDSLGGLSDTIARRFFLQQDVLRRRGTEALLG